MTDIRPVMKALFLELVTVASDKMALMVVRGGVCQNGDDSF